MKRGARSLPRFFVQGVHAPGDRVTLDAGDARKISTVLRLGDGDTIEAIDSAGTAFEAALSSVAGMLAAELRTVIERASETALRISLAQGVPKGQKMDFVVEKATEIGVAAILPFFSARTAGEHVGDAKLERWRRLARSAAQQSGRQTIPPVAEPLAWDALLARFKEFDCTLLAWEVAVRTPLLERLANVVRGAKTVLVVIGPEGGLAHTESEAAVARGAFEISLGSRILRTETAGIVACTALLLSAGEL